MFGEVLTHGSPANRNHAEIDVDVALFAKHARELADGHSVPDGKRVERGECRLAFKHRSFNRFAADRIHAIEHDELDLRVGCRFHRESHRRDVRVEARADVLHVEHERVEIRELFARGLSPVAVQAVNRKSARRIAIVRDVRVGVAANSVLGTEERHECDAGRAAQHVDRRIAGVIDAALIRDQAEPHSAQRFVRVALQHVDAVLRVRAASDDVDARMLRRPRESPDRLRDERAELLLQRNHAPLAVGMHAVREKDVERVRDRIDPQESAGPSGVSE
jgi:hypothetical protein